MLYCPENFTVNGETSYNFRGMDKGTTYYFAIEALGEAGRSAMGGEYACCPLFYDKMGDKLWGKYGFYDAFSETENWCPSRYLAIDQGPIVVMIENYRTQLLWNLFMQDKDIQAGLTKLGFSF